MKYSHYYQVSENKVYANTFSILYKHSNYSENIGQ